MVNPGLEVTEVSELQSQLQLVHSSSLGELTVTRLLVEGAKVLVVVLEVVLELVVEVLVLVEVVLVSVVTSKRKVERKLLPKMFEKHQKISHCFHFF